MLTEEVHSAGVLDDKIVQHEDAAHEKRNWVRLTYDCNNKCIFCLDSDTHDGEMRDPEEVKRQILDGRRKGATRLILSGGEPTIHPRYLDFIKLGSLAGYRRIQTVTNGRLFAYQEFIDRCLAAGLQEITFSLHGPNARIHDALVGVKGAFAQESAGLRKALDDGRPIVNVDIVINKGNVKALPEMLETFYGWGVREFDLLQVVPFGAAFREGRDILFYDLDDAAEYLQEALVFSQREDVHVWFNRFPPPHLEGFEHLIQDPYKLNDEVRGRKEEFKRQLDAGEPLDCREPGRCRYCYLEQLCDVLEDTQSLLHEETFERVRVDTEAEEQVPALFGGDPASARRAQNEKPRLPMFGENKTLTHRKLEERLASAPVKRLWIVAPDVARAEAAFAGLTASLDDPSGLEVELELDRYDGLEGSTLRVAKTVARDVDTAKALLEGEGSFEVELLLTKETARWLSSLRELPGRLALRQPTYERLSDAASSDVDAPEFFGGLFERHTGELAVEGLPPCVLGRAPRTAPKTLDAAMVDEAGHLEIFRYARRYIESEYYSKSRRCKDCVHDASCRGLHINQVRAHGYRWLEPITAADT